MVSLRARVKGAVASLRDKQGARALEKEQVRAQREAERWEFERSQSRGRTDVGRSRRRTRPTHHHHDGQRESLPSAAGGRFADARSSSAPHIREQTVSPVAGVLGVASGKHRRATTRDRPRRSRKHRKEKLPWYVRDDQRGVPPITLSDTSSVTSHSRAGGDVQSLKSTRRSNSHKAHNAASSSVRARSKTTSASRSKSPAKGADVSKNRARPQPAVYVEPTQRRRSSSPSRSRSRYWPPSPSPKDDENDSIFHRAGPLSPLFSPFKKLVHRSLSRSRGETAPTLKKLMGTRSQSFSRSRGGHPKPPSSPLPKYASNNKFCDSPRARKTYPDPPEVDAQENGQYITESAVFSKGRKAHRNRTAHATRTNTQQLDVDESVSFHSPPASGKRTMSSKQFNHWMEAISRSVEKMSERMDSGMRTMREEIAVKQGVDADDSSVYAGACAPPPQFARLMSVNPAFRACSPDQRRRSIVQFSLPPSPPPQGSLRRVAESSNRSPTAASRNATSANIDAAAGTTRTEIAAAHALLQNHPKFCGFYDKETARNTLLQDAWIINQIREEEKHDTKSTDPNSNLTGFVASYISTDDFQVKHVEFCVDSASGMYSKESAYGVQTGTKFGSLWQFMQAHTPDCGLIAQAKSSPNDASSKNDDSQSTQDRATTQDVAAAQPSASK